MPQITNLTIGPAVTIDAVTDRIFRAVPQVSGAVSTAFENSASGAPELATKISISTARKASYEQKSMVRVTHPTIRSIDSVETRIASAIAQTSFEFPPQATFAEKAALVDDLCRVLKLQFTYDVLVLGESLN